MAGDWDTMFTFLVEGVAMFIAGCLGLLGNVFSVVLLLKQKVRKTFHNLLLLLCSFDMVSKYSINLWIHISIFQVFCNMHIYL